MGGAQHTRDSTNETAQSTRSRVRIEPVNATSAEGQRLRYLVCQVGPSVKPTTCLPRTTSGVNVVGLVLSAKKFERNWLYNQWRVAAGVKATRRFRNLVRKERGQIRNCRLRKSARFAQESCYGDANKVSPSRGFANERLHQKGRSRWFGEKKTPLIQIISLQFI
jgi:hypothetical protein